MPRRPFVVLAAALVAVLLSPSFPSVAGADDRPVVEHRPPVPDPIVDRFDLPEKAWQAGNRGIDFGTAPGAPVAASADGEVVFAGPVAGALHVTVLHADGLRTSYSFLAEIRVREGQRVGAGDVVGLARGLLHFGVRAPDGTYLDPEELLAGLLEPPVRLVPGAEEGLDRLQEQRSLLDALFGGGAAVASFVAEQGGDLVELAGHYAVELNPVVRAARVAADLERWREQQEGCTPGSTPTPDHGLQRRIAVVVSGLGTTSDSNSAWNIDTGALGYETSDVVRFSYAGGRSPRDDEPAGWSGRGARNDGEFARDPDPDLEDIPESLFDADDSQQSLEVSAERLEVLLQQVAAAEPGVPIDVLAHSQGGVVARLGVVGAGASGELPATVENLVTIGSPHQGAPMATGVQGGQSTPAGRLGLEALRASGLAGPLDDQLPAITQLSETSDVLESMRDLPTPAGVRFTSIGGSGDLVVPAQVTADPAADRHVIVSTAAHPDAHGDLTEMEATTREIALATAGMGPSCQSLLQGIRTAAQGDGLRTAETMAGAAGLAAVTSPGANLLAGALGRW